MLRTNLSTRPFYNERAVRLGLALAVLLIAALTAFNVFEIAALNQRNAELSAQADDAERRVAEYRRDAQAIRQSLNSVEMTAVQQSAQEANQLIDRRVFSWTELFNVFEQTLPPEVRIAGVEPQVDPQGRMLVAMTVLSQRPEDLNEFMDRLEETGRFRDVLSRQDQPEEGGLTRSILQGYYDATPRPAGAAPDASESNGTAGNDTPGAPPAGGTTPAGALR